MMINFVDKQKQYLNIKSQVASSHRLASATIAHLTITSLFSQRKCFKYPIYYLHSLHLASHRYKCKHLPIYLEHKLSHQSTSILHRKVATLSGTAAPSSGTDCYHLSYSIQRSHKVHCIGQQH